MHLGNKRAEYACHNYIITQLVMSSGQSLTDTIKTIMQGVFGRPPCCGEQRRHQGGPPLFWSHQRDSLLRVVVRPINLTVLYFSVVQCVEIPERQGVTRG